MNTMVRNLVVGGSMFLFFWVGCTDDEETDEDGTTTTAASTGPTSTGTMGQTGTVVSTTAPASSSTGGGNLYDCNPVTNEPCTGGQACDFSSENRFVCFEPPNEQAICEACDNANGPFCQGTMSCNGGDNICRRYCCDNADCGPTLMCDLTAFSSFGITDVGVCMGAVGGAGGGTGAGGAGGGGPVEPGCSDVPAVAPSNGSCVPFP